MQRIFIVIALIIGTSVPVFAQKAEVFAISGKAIRGYDPVAYFTDSKAVEGKSQFVHSWNGTNWYFVSVENLAMFKKQPGKYAPQYGGYCAYGMANGYKAPTESDAWTIVNGKLYLNYNKEVQKLWNEKPSGFIETADKNWPQVKGEGGR